MTDAGSHRYFVAFPLRDPWSAAQDRPRADYALLGPFPSPEEIDAEVVDQVYDQVEQLVSHPGATLEWEATTRRLP